MASREEKRYNTLVDNGFLHFEAIELKKMPMNVPYWKKVIKERRKNYKAELEKGITPDDWTKRMVNRYRRKKWRSKDIYTERLTADPWVMLRAFEDKYKEQRPDYESPPKKKPVRKHRDIRPLLDEGKGQEKYPRGRAYKEKGAR